MGWTSIAFIVTLAMILFLAFLLISLHQDDIIREERVSQVTFRGKGRLLSINFGNDANYYPYSAEMDFDGELTFRFDRSLDPHTVHAMFISDGSITCNVEGVRITVVNKG